jgi:hypothetical protein
MTEDEAFARIGRQAVQIEQLGGAYGTLLDLLAKVVRGDIDRSRILVNLTDRTWAYCEAGATPALPAQINGLPVCVVGSPEPPLLPVTELIIAEQDRIVGIIDEYAASYPDVTETEMKTERIHVLKGRIRSGHQPQKPPCPTS